MVEQGHAVWLTGGTPKAVRKQVRKNLRTATWEHRVPVFVAYNIPFRDCSQYSAGGALDTASYQAWIDAVAAGIGSRKAVVMLEPDSLGIIPYDVDINGNMEWCQPTLPVGMTAAQANQARYDQLAYAIDKLEAQPQASVYLDTTHSNWLGVGDVSQRLVKAGVQKTQGFFLNVSNYQATDHLIKYGTWISK